MYVEPCIIFSSLRISRNKCNNKLRKKLSTFQIAINNSSKRDKKILKILNIPEYTKNFKSMIFYFLNYKKIDLIKNRCFVNLLFLFIDFSHVINNKIKPRTKIFQMYQPHHICYQKLPSMFNDPSIPSTRKSAGTHTQTQKSNIIL